MRERNSEPWNSVGDQRISYQWVKDVSKENHQTKLNCCINPDIFSAYYTQISEELVLHWDDRIQAHKALSKHSIPIVVAVMDASRPNMQENGRDNAIAPDPIFEICPDDNIRNSLRLGR